LAPAPRALSGEIDDFGDRFVGTERRRVELDRVSGCDQRRELTLTIAPVTLLLLG
jgi:hypothetical protein